MKKAILVALGFLAFGASAPRAARAEPNFNSTMFVEPTVRFGLECSTRAIASASASEITNNMNVSSATANVTSIYIKNLDTAATLYHWPGASVSSTVGDPILPQASATTPFNWESRTISPRQPYYVISAGGGATTKAVICITR